MRVEGGEHAVDGIFDEFALVGWRHVLCPHPLEDVTEDGQFLIGRRTGSLRRHSRRVDDAHGRGTHQSADDHQRSLTNHFVPFRVPWRSTMA